MQPTNPADDKMKVNFKIHRVWTSLLVFGTYLLIDFLYYGLINPVSPYAQNLLPKLIWMFVWAFAFTAIYNHAATWHGKGEGRKLTLSKLGNSVLFSLMVSLLLIAFIAFSTYLVSVVYLYLLDGFRGIPESGIDDAILVVEVVSGGIVLELSGKDETTERRNG